MRRVPRIMQTLTVQDVIWINLVATGRPCDFDYEKLEAAAFRQLGYGLAENPAKQAAEFMEAVASMKPFAVGNAETALIACMAFLGLSGLRLRATPEEGVARGGGRGRCSRDARQALGGRSGSSVGPRAPRDRRRSAGRLRARRWPACGRLAADGNAHSLNVALPVTTPNGPHFQATVATYSPFVMSFSGVHDAKQLKLQP